MTELTLEEKMAQASYQAKHLVAEKHFFDAAQPFFPMGFSVVRRNPGHWDVYAEQCPGKASAFEAVSPNNFTTAKDGDKERAFCIRGEPGNIFVRDERWNPHLPQPRPVVEFSSVSEAMKWISDILMGEPSGKRF